MLRYCVPQIQNKNKMRLQCCSSMCRNVEGSYLEMAAELQVTLELMVGDKSSKLSCAAYLSQAHVSEVH